jgi:hypothetical protein
MLVNGTADAALEALQSMLAEARTLAKRLQDDPHLDRLIRAFQLFPAGDREAILQVIEKDASWRRIVEQTDGATGISVHPNPHASLYVHVLNRVGDTEARDADVIRLGVATFVQMLPFLFQESVRAQWSAAGREVARTSDGVVRGLARRLLREVEAIIDGADAESRG